MHDPIQHALETQTFQVECQVVSATVGEASLVKPHPQVAENERDRNEQQAQARIASTGINPRLPHLAIACFDAESFAILLANLDRRTLHSPSGEQQFLSNTFFVFAVLVRAIVDAHRHRHLPTSVSHRVRIPTGRLLLDPAQPGRFATFLGRPTAKHHRHQEWQFFLLQKLDHRHVEERSIEKNYLDFQAYFPNSRQQAIEDRDRRFVSAHPGEGQRVTLAVLTMQADA